MLLLLLFFFLYLYLVDLALCRAVVIAVATFEFASFVLWSNICTRCRIHSKRSHCYLFRHFVAAIFFSLSFCFFLFFFSVCFCHSLYARLTLVVIRIRYIRINKNLFIQNNIYIFFFLLQNLLDCVVAGWFSSSDKVILCKFTVYDVTRFLFFIFLNIFIRNP